ISPTWTQGTDISVYDLTTRPGMLMMQVGDDTSDSIVLRQDYTIPDGSGVCAKLHPGIAAGDNQFQVDIGVNASDTSPTTGTYARVVIDSQGSYAWRYSFDGSTNSMSFRGSDNSPAWIAITRSGLEYTMWGTEDPGGIWHRGSVQTFG